METFPTLLLSGDTTRSKITWYCIHHYRSWGKIPIRFPTQKRHPIPRPDGRTTVCFCENFGKALQRPLAAYCVCGNRPSFHLFCRFVNFFLLNLVWTYFCTYLADRCDYENIFYSSCAVHVHWLSHFCRTDLKLPCNAKPYQERNSRLEGRFPCFNSLVETL